MSAMEAAVSVGKRITSGPPAKQPVMKKAVPSATRAGSLESLIEAIDNKDAKIALVRARADATGKPFVELMLGLCANGNAEAADDALLATVNWASDPVSDATAEGTAAKGSVRHAALISDLAALKKSVTEVTSLGHLASQILSGYARMSTLKVSALLLELHEAGALAMHEKEMCAVITLQTNTVRWEDSKWEASGAPTFVRLRDARGRRAKMVFLGSVQEFAEDVTPSAVCLRQWGLAKPSTAITVDAGTMHPRHCDESHEADDEEAASLDTPRSTGGGAGARGLASLPKFKQFLAEAGEEESQRTARAALRSRSDHSMKGRIEDAMAGRISRSFSSAGGSLSRQASGQMRGAPAGGAPQRTRVESPRASSSSPPGKAAAAASAPSSAEQAAAAVKIQRNLKWRVACISSAHRTADHKKIARTTKVMRSLKEVSEEKRFRINDLVFDKMLTVFTALLDAATLSNSWIVVDRTQGEGGYSATAEYMLEIALERCSRRPTIIVIDSLQRLREASNVADDINDGIAELTEEGADKRTIALLPRNGQRSFIMHNQLKHLYDGARARAVGSRKPGVESDQEQLIDFRYEVSDFATSDGREGTESGKGYTMVPDKYLPFEVLHEHKTRIVLDDGTTDSLCEPNRKWSYFYDDSMFSSGTHYIIKNKDVDEFHVSNITSASSYLYAHGDKRTCGRLRNHIQQGHQIVMLYNSGGISQLFSWLQRVMAHNASPPSILRMRDPLELLVAAVPSMRGLVGVPEMLVFQTLAERAPHLFRKKIVSVDLLLDNDEKMLQIITGCFSGTGGGVPELGLGNAEIVVQYSAWSLVRDLHRNAGWFKKMSDLLQTILWLLALLSCIAAIITSGALDKYFEHPASTVDPELISTEAGKTIIILPIVTAFLTTVNGRMKWRDKWSICYTAESQIIAELYHFRMGTGPYNPSMLRAKAGGEGASAASEGDLQGGGDGQQSGGGQTELSRRARELFSERCQTLYGECLEKLSDGGSMKRNRKRILHEHRVEREHRYTFKQWIALKGFLEKVAYHTTWAMPLDEHGLNFDSWITGLRPYLERTLQDELLASLETMEDGELVELQRVASAKTTTSLPLTTTSHPLLRRVRHKVERQLKLRKGALQKNADVFKALVLSAIATAVEDRSTALPSEGSGTTGRRPSISGGAGMGGADSPNDGRRRKLNSKEQAGRSSAQVAPAPDEETAIEERDQRARAALSNLQGEPDGLQSKSETRKQQKFESVEDDYLVGALAIESYVVFRTRPILERLERRGRRLAILLQAIEVLVFLIQSARKLPAEPMAGTILSAISMGEWVALTVTLAGLITERLAGVSMREQLVTTNLAVRALQNKVTWWDGQTLVVRRAYHMRRVMVEATEAAYLKMVEGHANAAAAAQEQEMEGGGELGADGDEQGEKSKEKAESKAGGGKGGGKSA